LSVVAENGQASGHKSDRVSSDVNSGGIGDGVKPFGPFFVSNSRGTESDDLDIAEFFRGLDINKADASKSST